MFSLFSWLLGDSSQANKKQKKKTTASVPNETDIALDTMSLSISMLEKKIAHYAASIIETEAAIRQSSKNGEQKSVLLLKLNTVKTYKRNIESLQKQLGTLIEAKVTLESVIISADAVGSVKSGTSIMGGLILKMGGASGVSDAVEELNESVVEASQLGDAFNSAFVVSDADAEDELMELLKEGTTTTTGPVVANVSSGLVVSSNGNRDDDYGLEELDNDLNSVML